MSRRRFLRLAGGALVLGACTPAPPAHPSGRTRAVRAVAFDLFTVFDPRGVDRRVTDVLGDRPAFAATWKSRLFEYCWIRAAAGSYADFEHLVRDALVYAARTERIEMSAAQQRALEAAFVELTPWPDATDALRRLRARGLRLSPLANFSPRMIDALFASAKVGDLFDARISTDAARTYKPDPRAYALAESALGLPREQIAFAAFGGWDAAGAKWFGFPTFWVNRLGVATEQLAAADASGPDLIALTSWLDARWS